jgi:hypothetical protein
MWADLAPAWSQVGPTWSAILDSERPSFTPTVRVAGTDWSPFILDQVQIVNGARAWWEQTVAGQAVFTVYADEPDIFVADDVVITAGSSSYSQVFVGTVASISSRRDIIGTFHDVTCYGPLAKAARRDVLEGRPVELDGERIAGLIDDALGVQWREAAGTWEQQTGTFADREPDLTDVDQPGVYNLEAIPSTPSPVMEALAAAAFSAGGHLYETPDGRIGYADSARRGLLIPNGVIDIPGNVIDLSTVAVNQTIDDVVNVAIVDWSGGQVTINADTSLAIYGRAERQFQTILDEQSDAIDFGLRVGQFQSSPRRNVSGAIRVALDRIDDSALLDQLLTITPNVPVSLEGAGPTITGDLEDWLGFVEGFDLYLGSDRAALDLYLSDYTLSIYRLRWADVADTVAWEDVDAMLEWQQATESL